MTHFVHEGPVQPRWARWSGFAVGVLAASGLPALGLVAVGLEGVGASGWLAPLVVPLHSAALAVAAWTLVRPPTIVDTTAGTVRVRGWDRRVVRVDGWGRTGRSGWVAVKVEGVGTRVLHTEPDDAEPLAGSLGPAADPIVVRPDGFEAIVPGTPWICGADALPGCLALQWLGYTALPAVALVLFTVFLVGTIGVGGLGLLMTGIAVLAGSALGMTALLTPVWLLSRSTWPRRVEVRGSHLIVTGAHRLPGDGVFVQRLRLRGEVRAELEEGSRGARLTVRSDDGAVRIPGPNLVLRQLRDAILAVRPTAGDRSELPETLASARRAGGQLA